MLLLSILVTLTLSSVLCEYPGLIPGPAKINDSVCIVGANFAGVHMAIKLKDMGFTDVVLIEEMSSPSGKDGYSRSHRGADHELGNHHFFPNGNIGPLADLFMKFQNIALQKLTEPSVWVNETTSFPFHKYLLMQAIEFYGNNHNESSVTPLLIAELQRYQQFHRNMLGVYTGLIFDEPNWSTKFALFGSFDEVLNRNNFHVIKPILKYFFTTMGYGKLTDMAATYGLMFCTPDTMQPFIDRLNGDTTSTGFQHARISMNALLSRMITNKTLNVLYSSKVFSLTRTPWYVTLGIRTNNVEMTRNCDFVMWAANIRKSLKYWKNPSHNEYQNFLRAQQRYAVKTLVDTENQRLSDSPIDFRLDPENDGDFLSAVDSYALSRNFAGIAYRLRAVASGDDGDQSKKSAVYSQFSNNYPSVSNMNNALRNTLTMLGGVNVTVIETKVWSYSPHYYHRDLTNNMLYEILKMQGRDKLWYIDPSVSFDSIASMVAYNNLLVSKMVSPQRF